MNFNERMSGKELDAPVWNTVKALMQERKKKQKKKQQVGFGGVRAIQYAEANVNWVVLTLKQPWGSSERVPKLVLWVNTEEQLNTVSCQTDAFNLRSYVHTVKHHNEQTWSRHEQENSNVQYERWRWVCKLQWVQWKVKGCTGFAIFN